MLDRDLADIIRHANPDFFHGRRILITGCRGFLGSYLDAVLRLMGAEVHGLDLPDDICAHVTCPFQPEIILHAASVADPRAYLSRPLETFKVNVLGTQKVLEFARLMEARVVHFSSSEVYGTADVVPTPEDYIGRVDPQGLHASYAESKRAAETLCSIYTQEYGVPILIVRPFNVYGPYDTDDQRVMPSFRRAVALNEPLHLTGGEQTRSFCYIADACIMLLRLISRGYWGQSINIGSGVETSVAELAALVNKVCERPADLIETGTAPLGVTRRCPDVSRVRALTGWHGMTPLEEGIRRYFLEWHFDT